MSSEIRAAFGGKEVPWMRTAGARGEGGRLAKAGLVAAAVLLLAAAAAAAAGKTHPRNSWERDQGDRLFDLALSPDGKTVAIFEVHQKPWTVRVWDVQAKKQLASLTDDAWSVGCPIAFTPDGASLLVLGTRRVDHDAYSPSVGVWDAKSFTLSRTVDLEFDPDWCVAVFTPDGKSLVVGTRSRRVGVYDLQTGKRTLDLVCDEPPEAFAPPPKLPPRIASKVTMPPHIPPGPALAVSADGKTLAVGTHERFLFFFDLTTGKVLQKNFVGFPVELLAFSPDGRTLVSANAGGARELQVWDVATGKNIDTLRVHFDIGGMHSMAFSPDGKTLAVGGERGGPNSIALWDIERFGFRDDFRGRSHGDFVGLLVFSADGKTLVSAGQDAPVEFWDVPAGAPKGVRQDPQPPAPELPFDAFPHTPRP